MKSAWRDTTRSLSSESKGIKTAGDMRHGTPLTSLERLQKRYRLFAIAGMTACPTSLIFLNQRIFPHNNGIWLAIAFAVYFITCFTMDWWLYYGIGSIDCVRMSVREVSEKAMLLPQTASAVCYDSYSLRTHPVWLACICKFGRYLSSCRHGNRGILRTRDRFVPSVSIPARLQKH